MNFRTFVADLSAERAALSTHLIAIAALLLIIVALFWRVFIFGESLVDLAAHENQLPWGAAAQDFPDYPYNRRDLTDTYITRDYFVVDSYRNGELPLWNPLIFTGHPMYADGVTKLFSPTNLFYYFGCNIPLGYSLSRLLELALATIFLYLLLNHLRLTPTGAFTGSLIFLLSDHTMQHLTWMGWLGGLMWLPIMILCADLALQRGRIIFAILAGAALALQFYCGYMPAAIYYISALALYYLIAPWLQVDKSEWLSFSLRTIKYLAISLITGLGLSAMIWLPIFQLLGFSNRKIVPTEIGYIWLPPWQLLTLILPRAFGQAFDTEIARRFVEVGVSQDRSAYLGLITLGLIMAAFYPLKALRNKLKTLKNNGEIDRSNEQQGVVNRLSNSEVEASTANKSANTKLLNFDRRIYYFALLAVGALLVMMCAPIYVHVTKYLPVLKTIRAVTRISGLYAFGTAVLAAYGMANILYMESATKDRLIRLLQRAFFWMIASVIAIAAIFNIVGRYLPQNHEDGNRIRRWLLKILITLAEHLKIGDIEFLISLGILILCALLFWSYFHNDQIKKLLPVLMIIILFGELAWQSNQYNDTFPSNKFFISTGAIEFLKSNIGPYRLVVAPPEFSGKSELSDRPKIVAPPNTLVPYKLNTISGKNQLFPKWYRELTSIVEPQNFLSHIVFKKYYAPLYDLLGVKYLVTRDVNSTDDPVYKEVYHGDGVRIYENLRVMPRAFFADDVEQIKEDDGAIKLMKDEDFDLHKEVVVTTKSSLPEFSEPNSNDLINLESYRNNSLLLHVKTDATKLLVLTDLYYPGWQVTIDNKPAEILRVDHALRGVVINAGDHKVEFVFRPTIFKYGVIISLISLLGCLILIVADKIFSKRLINKN